MTVKSSLSLSDAEIAQNTEAVRALFAEYRVQTAEGFTCAGTPQIMFNDLLIPYGEKLDPEPFKGRMQFGGHFDSTDLGMTPGGPVRLSLIRWGSEPDQCGKITVGKSDLVSTSIASYIGVTIGDNVHFEPRVTIMDCDGHPADRTLPDIPENKKMAPVVIEDGAWIGYGAVITKGVTIGKNAVVAPGSVVMWDVPADSAVAGSPAKSTKVYRKHLKD